MGTRAHEPVHAAQVGCKYAVGPRSTTPPAKITHCIYHSPTTRWVQATVLLCEHPRYTIQAHILTAGTYNAHHTRGLPLLGPATELSSVHLPNSAHHL